MRQEMGTDGNYFLSVVEQELCARAHTFVGSKYSTWTDTVRGLRIHAQTNRGERPNNNWLFEALYLLGVKSVHHTPSIHGWSPEPLRMPKLLPLDLSGIGTAAVLQLPMKLAPPDDTSRH